MKTCTNVLILAFAFMALQQTSLAQVSPQCSVAGFDYQAAPLCPAQGLILPETYPVQSFSISDDTEGYAYVEAMVEKVFQAQPSPAPLIFLNVSAESFAKLAKHFENLPWATATMKQNLVWVQATGKDEFGDESEVTLNWQQDFYKGSFNPKTGAAVARMMMDYPDAGNLPKAMADDLKACGMEVGEPLPSKSKSFYPYNGMSGGNIDSVPSGICLVGDADMPDDLWETYSKGVCGDAVRVKAPTSWLESFHVDEIFRVVPTDDPAPCNFAMLFASPDKAVEVLKNAENEPAFEFQGISESDFDYKQSRLTGMSMFCGILEELNFEKTRGMSAQGPELTKSIRSDLMVESPSARHIVGAEIAPGIKCDQAKNADLLTVLKAKPIVFELNKKIQTKITSFKQEVLGKLSQTLPQCRIKAIDIPNLFVGRIQIQKDGQRILAPGTEKSGYSVFPNPANADVIGKTIILPEPMSPAIKRNLNETLSGLGMKAQFINTIKGFEVLGNVHCETQTLRYCRPR